jgi:hypothetical protein
MLVNHLLPVGVQFAGRAVVNEAGCDGSPQGTVHDAHVLPARC